jgi:hypothetical protein
MQGHTSLAELVYHLEDVHCYKPYRGRKRSLSLEIAILCWYFDHWALARRAACSAAPPSMRRKVTLTDVMPRPLITAHQDACTATAPMQLTMNNPSSGSKTGMRYTKLQQAEIRKTAPLGLAKACLDRQYCMQALKVPQDQDIASDSRPSPSPFRMTTPLPQAPRASPRHS